MALHTDFDDASLSHGYRSYDAIDKHKVTHYGGAPTVMNILLEAAEKSKRGEHEGNWGHLGGDGGLLTIRTSTTSPCVYRAK